MVRQDDFSGAHGTRVANNALLIEKSTKMRSAIAIFCLSLVIPAYAGTNPAPHEYTSDLNVAVKIGDDLYATLDPDCQKLLSPRDISTIKSEVPEITPIAEFAGGKMGSQVLISTGYINLINHIAHAKAIDNIQPGYFQQYVSNLGKVADGEALPEPPNMVDPRYWSDSVMNDQMSYFNQIIGVTLAINLSHHYLGHYQKYSGAMLAGKFTPINAFIQSDEWDASVKAATVNSLDCALAPGGAAALFEAIANMPNRPPWTGYIVPQNVDLKKLNGQLASYEQQYFHGGLKAPKAAPYLSGVTKKKIAN
jgi:hypothetical protein